jgi:integrase-like protein
MKRNRFSEEQIIAVLREHEAGAKTGWRKYYNEERPHGAIGQKTPISLLNHAGAARLREEPEKSTLRRSKVRPHCTSAETLMAAG